MKLIKKNSQQRCENRITLLKQNTLEKVQQSPKVVLIFL